ncbi:hypothetical protein [Clostridium sp.]|jgi:UDP-N-acetyl-D-glucosamine dehydrogenase|uniref:hypothetical protein n=1 Tax=Clostridium sp. TaxID=1506 RepID=UPI003FA537B5
MKKMLLDEYQQPNISYIKSSTEAISKYLKKNTIVVLESTTYPGTTEEFIKPILEQSSSLKCGKDFYLGFSLKRVDPGNLIYKTKTLQKLFVLLEKVLENTYRDINIGLINELTMLCNKVGISICEWF